MKGMDITFPLIPLSFLWVKLCKYYSHTKTSIFFKKLKKLKFDQLCSAEKLNFLDTYNLAAIPRGIEILT